MLINRWQLIDLDEPRDFKQLRTTLTVVRESKRVYLQSKLILN